MHKIDHTFFGNLNGFGVTKTFKAFFGGESKITLTHQSNPGPTIGANVI
jgi:hypothetical protein